MKLEHLLLGLLGRKPSTGYDIRGFLNTHGRFLRSNTTMSQVYRSLARMTEAGWVTFDVDARPGAQDAKIYRVTPEGMTVLLDWLTGPYTPPSRFQEPEFLARLSFAGYMTRTQVFALVDTELTARREQVVHYRHRDRSMSAATLPGFDNALSEAMGERLHLWGARQIDAYIAELEVLRADVERGALGGSDLGPRPYDTAPAPHASDGTVIDLPRAR